MVRQELSSSTKKETRKPISKVRKTLEAATATAATVVFEGTAGFLSHIVERRISRGSIGEIKEYK